MYSEWSCFGNAAYDSDVLWRLLSSFIRWTLSVGRDLNKCEIILLVKYHKNHLILHSICAEIRNLIHGEHIWSVMFHKILAKLNSYKYFRFCISCTLYWWSKMWTSNQNMRRFSSLISIDNTFVSDSDVYILLLSR